MKTVIVFLVLLATVYCHPVKRSASSSDSSEEVVRTLRLQLKVAPVLRKTAPAQTMTAESDDSSDSSDEAQLSYTASEDENDTDSEETEESEEPITEPTTEPPTEPPIPFETTLPPVTDSGRGDNLGYPSDYKKSIVYVKSKKNDKGSSPYKYYDVDKAVESLGLVSKKASVYGSKGGNDIEKNLRVHKALQAHDEFLEEGTSTPEEESQGLDTVGGTAEGPTQRQAEPEPEATTAKSVGTEEVEEEEEESASTAESTSVSISEEEEEEESDIDIDSLESIESQERDEDEAPVVITAK